MGFDQFRASTTRSTVVIAFSIFYRIEPVAISVLHDRTPAFCGGRVRVAA
jgi:hypothetical protein